MLNYKNLASQDPDILEAINREVVRQNEEMDQERYPEPTKEKLTHVIDSVCRLTLLNPNPFTISMTLTNICRAISLSARIRMGCDLSNCVSDSFNLNMVEGN